MAELVYNQLGATPAEPCPTAVSRWFDRGYCSREDFAMWRAAAANLYELGVLPLLSQLETLSAEQSAGFRPQVVDYRTRFNRLPAQGSVLSTARNLELVSDAVALMTVGDALVEGLRAAISAQGAAPLELAIPGPPPEPRSKSAWGRIAWPAAIVGGVGLVLGLAAWAAASGRAEASKPKGGNGGRRRP